MIYKIEHPIVDFYNRLQVSYFPESVVLFLYKKKDNYSSFMFWTEIKTVVDKIVLDYGVDDNFKLKFDKEKEQKEISNEVWQGRIWRRNSLITEILYNHDGFGLALRITFVNSKN